MIKLKIEKYRDFTAEEKEESSNNRKRNGYPVMSYETIPYERDRVIESVLDIEITNEQFEAIRKAVLEKF